jgi:FKBP-type peptidyl-prolyl cis-trans isomerase
MPSGFRRFDWRRQMLVLVVCVFGCQQKPAGREAYAGDPVRPAINANCTPALLDEKERPCVQIDVFAEGEGPQAARGEWVYVHYVVDADGNELDSSHDGKPLAFQLFESGNVIEGLHLGVEGMRVGERRRVTVPPLLGYRGQKLAGVPPEANLVFLVELTQRRETL